MQDITRRVFLKSSVGVVTVLSIAPTISAKSAKQPNILWISCEDISPHLGCYNTEHAITPNIDQFAKEGVRYTRAFTVHGVCAPSRSGIITGVYPSSLGSVNMRCRALKPNAVKCFTEYLRDDGYYCTNTAKEDYNFLTPKTAWDTSGGKAHWKNRTNGKPFFAVFNFTGTHESKLWNSADFDNTHPKRLNPSQWQKPENMKIPPIYPDTLEVRRDFARLFERITEFDYFVKDRVDELKKAGLYEDTIIFIWSDHGNGLPRAKRWLYDSGTLSPLLARVPEKYRTTGQAAPGITDDQLVSFIDLGSTVLNLAGIKMPEYMQGRPFLGPNLPAPRKYIFGARQRIDELHDMVRSVRDERYRYIVNFMPFVPYLPHLEYAEKCNTMKAMRKLYAEGKLNAVQAQWMADHRPAEELYDLENDPWETNDLADDPGCADVKKRLRKALAAWMIETRDAGLIPEPELVRQAQKFGGEYTIFRQTGGQDRVRRLAELAFIAAQPQQSDRPAIEAALTSDDPVARYWAVLAMRTKSFKNQKDIDKVRAAGQDDNPCVRIAAAWSLSLSGQKEKALSILLEELKRPDPAGHVMHFTLTVLDSLGEESRSALPAIKAIPDHKNKYISRIRNHFIEKYKICETK